MSMSYRICFFMTIILFFGCQKEEEMKPSVVVPVLPTEVFDYAAEELPEHIYTYTVAFFIDRPIINNHVATLGRVLFYDKQLSKNNTTACASCHLQEYAFSDNRALSEGFAGGHTRRNSMALVNVWLDRTFFWDRRASSLKEQVLMPIQDAIEMGMELEDLEDKLGQVDYYPQLFEAAFGDTTITSERIAESLKQFTETLVSYQSKYDKGLANDFVDFTAQEKEGMDLYFSGQFNCNHCHSDGNFYGRNSLNNGLDSDYEDKGRGEITGDASNNGQFKVPTLRNIELTAPYMHDGRFATLEEVIEHYNSGLQPHPNLDDRLASNNTTGGPPKQYNMTEGQKAALVAFLKTLTDKSFIEDEKFSNPFR